MESSIARRKTLSGLLVAGRHFRVAAAFTLALFLSAAGAHAQASSDDSQDKSLDIRSSVGDMHMGSDADARETGLPAYPGARLRKHDDDRNSANLALFTSAFGFKLVVVNYDSDAAPSKIIAYYRGKLKKYGRFSNATPANMAEMSALTRTTTTPTNRKSLPVTAITEEMLLS